MRYNDSERRERCALARAYRTSDLTKVEYCQRHGLSANSLDHWIREAAKEEPRANEASFFEVQVSDAAPAAPQSRQPDLEVELPMGVKLRFFGTAVVR